MQKITLNLIPDGVPPVVYVNQFDTGREFQISFKEGLSPYNFPSGVVFRINGRKADNHVFEYTESDKWDATHNIITKSGSGTSLTVTIATSEQMTAAAGEAEVQLTFKSSSASSDILGTLNFILAVQEKPDANGDPSESDLPDRVESVNGIGPDANGNVLLPPALGAIGAHNISTVEATRRMSRSYSAGNYVYVTADDQLYKVTSPIASGGILTPGTNAIASSISSDLVYSTSHVPNDITSRLGNLSKAIAEQNLEKYGYKIGDYFIGTGSTPYVYWLADLDTFYGGYNAYAVLSTPHVGVVVDTKLSSKWNDTVVAYENSTLHSLLTGTVLAQIKTDITARLGTWSSHMLAHDKLYNALGTWVWSSSNTRSEYISALTESQFYGAPIWSADSYQQGEGDKKLTIFDLFKYNRIFGNVSIWLRSIASSSWACLAYNGGVASYYPVTISDRVAGLILIY